MFAAYRGVRRGAMMLLGREKELSGERGMIKEDQKKGRRVLFT